LYFPYFPIPLYPINPVSRETLKNKAKLRNVGERIVNAELPTMLFHQKHPNIKLFHVKHIKTI